MRSVGTALAAASLFVTAVFIVPAPAGAGARLPDPYASGAGELSVRDGGNWTLVADDVWGVSPLSLGNEYFAEVSKPEVCAADQSGLIAIARLDAETGARELFGDGGHPVLSWDSRYLAYTGIDCDSNATHRLFRLVIRDLSTGAEVKFDTPTSEDSIGPGSFINAVSWDADSRHLLVETSTGPPGVSPEYWYIDTRSAGPTLDGYELPKLKHGRGPYGIAALGATGEWAAVVSADGGKGPVRIVRWDLRRAKPKRVLDRVPASREPGDPALLRVISDPSGGALLMLVGEENFASRLYELDIATNETRLLRDSGDVHAG